MTVTVHSDNPHCQPCRMTKLHLERRGIDYVTAPMDEARDAIEKHGFTGAPVVHAVSAEGIEQYWDQYRPDRIEALVGV